MYDVAVFDFDGVLFDGKKMYPCVKTMLETLKRNNITIFLASYNSFAGMILKFYELDN